MNYKEISRKEQIIEQKLVTTTVNFDFKDDGFDVQKTIDVEHFNPKDEKDIILGIENRYQSELNELKSIKK